MDRLKALVVFKAVADNRSFSGAATALDISCPCASRIVQGLESLLGARLFHRTTRRIALTAIGEHVFRCASDLLKAYEELESIGRESASVPSGKVRIAAPASIGGHCLGPALASFRASCPQVQIELQLCEGSLSDVSEDFDLSLCTPEDLRSAQIARPLTRVQIGLFAAPGYLARRGTPSHPSQLVQHDCLTSAGARASTTWSFMHSGSGETETLSVRGALHANHAEVLMDAAVHGAGIVMLPIALAEGAVASRQLHSILQAWRVAPIELHLAYTSRRHQPLSVRKLIEHLVDSLGAGYPEPIAQILRASSCDRPAMPCRT